MIDYLYRTTDVDDECIPLDHGVVRAKDLNEVEEILEAHFASLDFGGDHGENIEVKLYPLVDPGLGSNPEKPGLWTEHPALLQRTVKISVPAVGT